MVSISYEVGGPTAAIVRFKDLNCDLSLSLQKKKDKKLEEC